MVYSCCCTSLIFTQTCRVSVTFHCICSVTMLLLIRLPSIHAWWPSAAAHARALLMTRWVRWCCFWCCCCCCHRLPHLPPAACRPSRKQSSCPSSKNAAAPAPAALVSATSTARRRCCNSCCFAIAQPFAAAVPAAPRLAAVRANDRSHWHLWRCAAQSRC